MMQKDSENQPFDPGKFYRPSQIIGQKGVTPEQAEENRKRGKGPKTPRLAIPAKFPISRAKLYSDIKKGTFPPPAKNFGERTSVWPGWQLNKVAAGEDWNEPLS